METARSSSHDLMPVKRERTKSPSLGVMRCETEAVARASRRYPYSVKDGSVRRLD